MHGQFIADAALMIEPLWRNIFENGVMTQFVHRWVGALFLIGVAMLSFISWNKRILAVPMFVLLAVTSVQFLLGVAVLLLRVPVVLGSLHQAVACLLVLVLVYVVYIARPET